MAADVGSYHWLKHVLVGPHQLSHRSGHPTERVPPTERVSPTALTASTPSFSREKKKTPLLSSVSFLNQNESFVFDSSLTAESPWPLSRFRSCLTARERWLRFLLSSSSSLSLFLFSYTASLSLSSLYLLSPSRSVLRLPLPCLNSKPGTSYL